jgi:hypothetical protein
MMSMLAKDDLVVMVMMGKAQWEGDSIRCEDDCWMQVGGRYTEAYIHGNLVAVGNSLTISASKGDLVELKPMKPSRENFTREEIEAARKTKKISALYQERYGGGPFVFDGSLDEVIGSLAKIRAEIPEEYRELATCEIESESEYDSHHATISVSYARPETDEEVSERLRSELLSKELKEREERATLETLKRKYGS